METLSELPFFDVPDVYLNLWYTTSYSPSELVECFSELELFEWAFTQYSNKGIFACDPFLQCVLSLFAYRSLSSPLPGNFTVAHYLD